MATAHLAPDTPIAPWWQDEMRPGQKNALVRQRARTGTRPRLPKDQRHQSAYIFGTICPARGVVAAVVMANTEAIQRHLDEISRHLRRASHAVLLLDRAGWHITGDLTVPANLTLVFLAPRAPELNPTENIWQDLRQTHLSNRVFATYDDIHGAACQAWNRLIDKPSKIMSIGMRDRAHTGQVQWPLVIIGSKEYNTYPTLTQLITRYLVNKFLINLFNYEKVLPTPVPYEKVCSKPVCSHFSRQLDTSMATQPVISAYPAWQP